MPDSTILDKLYPDDKENKNKSSLSFTPALCASIQCAEAVKLLLGKESSLKNKVLFADLLTNEYRTFEL